MKNAVIRSMMLTFIAVIGSSVFFSAKAQATTTSPKVYVVINKADWCPVCQANGPRIMSEVMPACKDLNVKFVANDLTNEQTIATSTEALKKNKVFNAVKEINATGVILLVDAETKKIIKQISVNKSTEEIVKEITAAQS